MKIILIVATLSGGLIPFEYLKPCPAATTILFVEYVDLICRVLTSKNPSGVIEGCAAKNLDGKWIVVVPKGTKPNDYIMSHECAHVNGWRHE